MEADDTRKDILIGLFSTPILVFFLLLAHQTFIGIFIDGAISFYIAKLYIEKYGQTECHITIAIIIFVSTLIALAFIIGFIARNVLNFIF